MSAICEWYSVVAGAGRYKFHFRKLNEIDQYSGAELADEGTPPSIRISIFSLFRAYNLPSKPAPPECNLNALADASGGTTP